jgi:glycine betaine/choline ABC-type transport system substrate-binding protein
LRFTAPRAFGEDAFAAFVAEYGLEPWVEVIEWAETLQECEALLKLGAADVAIVGNLEETLSSADFVVLKDDRRGFESADISVILRREVGDRFPEIVQVVSDLCPRLTEDVLHGLVSRMRLLHQDPTIAAREYLFGEGLLSE